MLSYMAVLGLIYNPYGKLNSYLEENVLYRISSGKSFIQMKKINSYLDENVLYRISSVQSSGKSVTQMENSRSENGFPSAASLEE